MKQIFFFLAITSSVIAYEEKISLTKDDVTIIVNKNLLNNLNNESKEMVLAILSNKYNLTSTDTAELVEILNNKQEALQPEKAEVQTA